jgi:hypothetical protein
VTALDDRPVFVSMPLTRQWMPTGSTVGPVTAHRVPERFRLSDVNPLTQASYAESLFVELPPWAVSVIGMAPQAWDALASFHSVFSVFDPDRIYDLTWLHRQVLARLDECPDPTQVICPECWGTLACRDWDGSLSGTLNAVIVCPCAPSFDW